MECNLDNPVLETALSLIKDGVPITLCGEKKRPIVDQWQNHVYTDESVRSAFRHNPSLNVGIVLGKKSGIVDIEGDKESSEEELRELFDGEIPRTPRYRSRRGPHYLFAYDERLEAIGKAVGKYKTIEIRCGAGGKAAHSLVPPSMTDEVEREWIESPDDCPYARMPDSVIRKIIPPEKPKKVIAGDKSRPGDDYNRNGPAWSEILGPNGWSLVGDNGHGVDYYRRPGKTEGISATVGHCKSDDGDDLFYVFTENGQLFEAGNAYSKFGAHALLNHAGDFSAAAADLAEQGYGKKQAAKQGPNESTRLTMLVLDDPSVQLFHSPDGDAYVTVEVDGHFENLLIGSKRFKQFLGRQAYRDSGRAPSTKGLSEALNTLTGMAVFDGPELPTALRVAAHGDATYIDIGSSAWNAIKVTGNGYEIIDRPPVKFLRSSGMAELPMPIGGGNVDMLHSLVNVRDEQLPLLLGAMVSYLQPRGPFVLSAITGEKGACKSTLMRLMRLFSDPSTVPLRCEPKDIKALMVNAQNNWVVTLDNVSRIPGWLSDALCRLSTGGGFGDRELYTNGEEYLMAAIRPVVMTSIVDVANRPDLMDRAIVVELDAIDKCKRKTEDDYWEEVADMQSQIFGFLLSALSVAIDRLQDIKIEDLPRMADFARLATAAEPALGLSDGAFMTAYRGNQEDARTTLLESKVAQAVVRLVDQAIHWKDTPTRTYDKLTSLIDDKVGDGWPKDASAMGSELRQLTPALREAGYHCKSGKSGGARFYEFTKA